MRTTILGGVALGLLLALPGPASAQSWAEAQVADLETMHEKFTSLAEAFPEDTYDWRPMEGVRSVKEVIALIAAECNLFPGYLGMDAPAGVAESFGAEMERLTAMSRSELLVELDRSFEHFIAQAEGLDESARMEKVQFFGREVDVGTGLMLAANDMHEHLGQAIAYARTNEIVPPWSQGDSM
jgi:uncharacterized damage-inducible protein DinB